MGRIEDGSKDKKYFPQSTAKLVQEEAVESTIVGIRANNLPVIIDSLGENINTSGHIDTGQSAVVHKEAAVNPARTTSTDDLAVVVDPNGCGVHRAHLNAREGTAVQEET